MKKSLFVAGLALGLAFAAAGTTLADTHAIPPRETYGRISGRGAIPFLRVARQDYECIENHCKAQIEQCRRTQSNADCNASSVCQQSARETGECDN